MVRFFSLSKKSQACIRNARMSFYYYRKKTTLLIKILVYIIINNQRQVTASEPFSINVQKLFKTKSQYLPQ